MKTFSRFRPTVVRVLLGGIFTAAGAAGLFRMGDPPPLSGSAAAFMGGLIAAGYFLPLLKLTELAAGLMLLSGRFVPLALTILAPIVLHIAAFHLTMAPEGSAMAILLVALTLVLAWHWRAAFAPLFSTKTTKAPAEVSVGDGQMGAPSRA